MTESHNLTVMIDASPTILHSVAKNRFLSVMVTGASHAKFYVDSEGVVAGKFL